MENSVDPDQTAPEQSVLGPHFLLVYLNSSVMLGNYLQQTTSADDIFRCIFHGALRVICPYIGQDKQIFFSVKL